jgi:hypothetical protein
MFGVAAAAGAAVAVALFALVSTAAWVSGFAHPVNTNAVANVAVLTWSENRFIDKATPH